MRSLAARNAPLRSNVALNALIASNASVKLAMKSPIDANLGTAIETNINASGGLSVLNRRQRTSFHLQIMSANV